MQLRTYDNANIAYGGYGLFWLQDDVAKITNFYLNNNGAINGVQVLHKPSVDAAFQRVPSDRGLDCNYPANGDEPRVHRYNYGTWEQEFTGSQVGCSGVPIYYQPYFSGYGGIRMAMMGNGLTYYYFSDNEEFEFTAEVIESSKVGPLCGTAAAAAAAEDGVSTAGAAEV